MIWCGGQKLRVSGFQGECVWGMARLDHKKQQLRDVRTKRRHNNKALKVKDAVGGDDSTLATAERLIAWDQVDSLDQKISWDDTFWSQLHSYCLYEVLYRKDSTGKNFFKVISIIYFQSLCASQDGFTLEGVLELKMIHFNECPSASWLGDERPVAHLGHGEYPSLSVSQISVDAMFMSRKTVDGNNQWNPFSKGEISPSIM